MAWGGKQEGEGYLVLQISPFKETQLVEAKKSPNRSLISIFQNYSQKAQSNPSEVNGKFYIKHKGFQSSLM